MHSQNSSPEVPRLEVLITWRNPTEVDRDAVEKLEKAEIEQGTSCLEFTTCCWIITADWWKIQMRDAQQNTCSSSSLKLLVKDLAENLFRIYYHPLSVLCWYSNQTVVSLRLFAPSSFFWGHNCDRCKKGNLWEANVLFNKPTHLHFVSQVDLWISSRKFCLSWPIDSFSKVPLSTDADATLTYLCWN